MIYQRKRKIDDLRQIEPDNFNLCVMTDIETYRDFCLSLGADVVEKMPFAAFPHGASVLVFYVHGHMFAFFDCDDYGIVTLKCQPDRIGELKARYDSVGRPFNLSPKHWIGVDARTAPADLLRELTRNSYQIVRAKYKE